MTCKHERGTKTKEKEPNQWFFPFCSWMAYWLCMENEEPTKKKPKRKTKNQLNAFEHLNLKLSLIGNRKMKHIPTINSSIPLQ